MNVVKSQLQKEFGSRLIVEKDFNKQEKDYNREINTSSVLDNYKHTKLLAVKTLTKSESKEFVS